MAVKIRLKRLGEKKNPFYRIIVADSRSPRMVDLSMKSVLMILITIHASSTLMLRLLRSGYQTELSLQRLLESFSRWLVSKNKTSGGVIDYERISGIIAKALVDNPDEVVVTETEKDKALVVNLKVAPSDMGKVIGKSGRIAKSIRAVVSAAASKSDKKVIVEIDN